MQDDSGLRAALSRMERNAKLAGREQLELGLKRQRRGKEPTAKRPRKQFREVTELTEPRTGNSIA